MTCITDKYDSMRYLCISFHFLVINIMFHCFISIQLATISVASSPKEIIVIWVMAEHINGMANSLFSNTMMRKYALSAITHFIV